MEDGVGGDFAGDFSEVVHTFADVLRDEVAAEGGFESVDGAEDGFVGKGERLVVSGVGDYKLVGVVFGEVGGID